MSEQELETVWTVLETEALAGGAGLEVVGTGATVHAGEVLLGVDSVGRRHLLIPLQLGEAFAEDRRGGSVHLVRVEVAPTSYLAAVCLNRDLQTVFAQFCNELIQDLSTTDSPARATVDALARWRQLFADAPRGDVLTEPKLIGLMAELLTLERIVGLDPLRRIECWAGPSGHYHDLRFGSQAIEVKGTLTREGRVVGISSVDQLRSPENGRLHLCHMRLEATSTGQNLPEIVGRIRNLGVQQALFDQKLSEAGVSIMTLPSYANRRYALKDERFYDVEGTHFPKVTPDSFAGSAVPAGVLKLRYSIDLTNEPPVPLTPEKVTDLLEQLATS